MAMIAQFDAFPLDIHQVIASFLSDADIGKLLLVSKRWKWYGINTNN
jgi:hypothetical protein